MIASTVASTGCLAIARPTGHGRAGGAIRRARASTVPCPTAQQGSKEQHSRAERSDIRNTLGPPTTL